MENIGYTSDLKRRLKEHQEGKAKSTKSRRPLRLLYYEAHRCKEDAQRREAYFRSSKGKSTLELILRESLRQL